MNLLQKRMSKIRQALRQRKPDLAASLLISTVSSDDMFSYWSGCCQGSERVPKILKYIKHIQFDENISTARINFKKGELQIGVKFFMEHIQGPEDLLFILTHERDHLILRKLFPGVFTSDYPGHLFNFGEDVYINAIARRFLPSTLPERFYKEPLQLLLTGQHSQIDWDLFKLHKDEFGLFKDAHGGLYQQNYALLKAIHESGLSGHYNCGYESWMKLVLDWHRQNKERSLKRATKKEPKQEQKTDSDENTETADDKQVSENESADNVGSTDNETKSHDHGEKDKPEDHVDKNEQDENAGDENPDEKAADDDPGGGDDQDNEEEITDQDTEALSREPDADGPDQTGGVDNGDDDVANGTDGDTDIEKALKAIVPLIEKEESDCPLNGSAECSRGLAKIPLPDLRPHDLIVQMILATCDLPEFRNQVKALEGEALKQVEGFIKGVLSDRATERSYDGYSISVPISITRRDVFTLSSGQIPVLWQRRVGIERPHIDVYVDVSGSMNKYYPYIPFIYEALKHVMGRLFQFSDQVVETDYRDNFLHTTGGTNFNKVGQHMINEKVQAAIIFSDGLGVLSADYEEPIKRQLKHLFFIKVQDNKYKSFEPVATQVIVLQTAEEQYV